VRFFKNNVDIQVFTFLVLTNRSSEGWYIVSAKWCGSRSGIKKTQGSTGNNYKFKASERLVMCLTSCFKLLMSIAGSFIYRGIEAAPAVSLYNVCAPIVM
jgi:hypothetical protein